MKKKIIVKVSTGEEFELAEELLYSNASSVASLINMKGLLNCTFIKASDGTLIMPRQIVYIREKEC